MRALTRDAGTLLVWMASVYHFGMSQKRSVRDKFELLHGVQLTIVVVFETRGVLGVPLPEK